MNGWEVAPERIKRFEIWDGKNWQGEDEPYELFRIQLEPGDVVRGDNEFAVSLRPQAGKGSVRIEELNIKVHPN